MSDLRVDTRAIEAKYGLHSPDQQVWSVTPVWQGEGKQVVTMDNAGAAADVVAKAARIFSARTMAQHREAVEAVSHSLLWDAPDIRLTNKGHLRLATYIFKRIAQPNIIPVAAIVSEPSLGCTLIELDTVYVLAFNKYWFVPITWLLPDESVSNVHMKIGVDGSLGNGKIEMMMARWTNWPPIPPLGWQRGLAGMALGAVPHAFEGLLGFLFDLADGDKHYTNKFMTGFEERHPASENFAVDVLMDLASGVANWALEQGKVAFESAQAVAQSVMSSIAELASSILNFYRWLFATFINLLRTATPEAVSVNVHKVAGALTSYTPHSTTPLDTAPASSMAYPPVTPLGLDTNGAASSGSAGAPGPSIAVSEGLAQDSPKGPQSPASSPKRGKGAQRKKGGAGVNADTAWP